MPRPALSAGSRTSTFALFDKTSSINQSKFEFRCVTFCSSVCPMTSIVSTSYSLVRDRSLGITSDVMSFVNGSVRSAFPLAKEYPLASLKLIIGGHVWPEGLSAANTGNRGQLDADSQIDWVTESSRDGDL